MSEFKGTPGPWIVCANTSVDSASGGICEVYGDYTSQEEDEANASLIAAAPELLEALQLIIKDLRIRAKVRGDIDDDGTVVLDLGSGALMKANDAIAKAFGQ